MDIFVIPLSNTSDNTNQEVKELEALREST